MSIILPLHSENEHRMFHWLAELNKSNALASVVIGINQQGQFIIQADREYSIDYLIQLLESVKMSVIAHHTKQNT
jgi:hypothetical protein